MKKHILICGEKGVGKSTLIERLLKDKNIPLYGFLTKRTQPYETGFHQVYMFAANEMFSDEKHKTYIGQSNSVDHSELIEVFDTLGVEYIKSAKPDGIIIMDELGYMESKADKFTKAVFDALNGDIPVIASVKNRFDVDFLNNVRAHEKGQIYVINEDNRDSLYEELKNVFDELIQF